MNRPQKLLQHRTLDNLLYRGGKIIKISRKSIFAAIFGTSLLLIALILFTHFVIMGSVSNLYSIQNYDGNEHTASVEVLNSNHRTI
jgi:hypothetical protein